jgi:hypothetical protein
MTAENLISTLDVEEKARSKDVPCWGCRPEAPHAKGPSAPLRPLSSACTKEMQGGGPLSVVRL